MIRTRHSSVFVHVGMLALLFAGLTGVGCQFVFGDFTLESGTGGEPASGGATSTVSGGSNSGGASVVGATGGTAGTGGTATLGTCNGTNVCCNVNQAHCQLDDAGMPNGTADVCNDTRTGWVTTGCAKGCLLGDGGSDTCAICTEGSALCVILDGVRVLRACIAGGWSTITCANNCVDATSTAPAACQ